jgi:hypothetical protein
MAELDRGSENLLHQTIHLSCTVSSLSNGMKCCTVQIECKAGCGYLLQAFGEEAEILYEKALMFKGILESPKASKSLLLSIVPGFITE